VKTFRIGFTLTGSPFRFPASTATSGECCSVPRLTRFPHIAILQDERSASVAKTGTTHLHRFSSFGPPIKPVWSHRKGLTPQPSLPKEGRTRLFKYFSTKTLFANTCCSHCAFVTIGSVLKAENRGTAALCLHRKMMCFLRIRSLDVRLGHVRNRHETINSDF